MDYIECYCHPHKITGQLTTLLFLFIEFGFPKRAIAKYQGYFGAKIMHKSIGSGAIARLPFRLNQVFKSE